jgi:hypothetical protein
LAKVSTLFMFVGLDQSPALAGNGGLVLGIPLCPSIEAMSAVSTANKGSGALFNGDVKIHSRSQDVVSK